MATFDNTFDILLGNEGAIQTKDGDFLTGDCSNRYIEYITRAFKGHWRERPTIGVGIQGYLNGTANKQVIERNIIAELKSDIFPTPDVDLSEYPEKIKINNIVVEKQND